MKVRMKILSLFSQSHIISKIYNFLSSLKHKSIHFNCTGCTFSCYLNEWKQAFNLQKGYKLNNFKSLLTENLDTVAHISQDDQ